MAGASYVLAVGWRSEQGASVRPSGDGSGWNTLTAADPWEAVDLAASYRPVLLLSEYMLTGHVTGVQLWRALRVLYPDLRSLLLTAFNSEDVQFEAVQEGVHAVIDWPADDDRLRSTIASALEAPAITKPSPAIGVVLSDAAGRIEYANEPARTLLANAHECRHAERLDDLFSPAAREAFGDALEDWKALPVRGTASLVWHVRARSRRHRPGHLMLVVDAGADAFRNHATVPVLMGTASPAARARPGASRVLVVDDFDLVRRVITAAVRQAGWFCHSTGCEATARRLFEADPDIRYVVLDYNMPGSDVASLVAWFHRIRPDVTIIGCSGHATAAEFAAIGVLKFLPKPLRITELVQLLEEL